MNEEERKRAGLSACREAEAKRLDINLKHLEAGVRFVDIRTAYIDEEVIIGADTVIGPCVSLTGRTVIGRACTIGQNSQLADSIIEDGVQVRQSVILESRVGRDSTVGPFAYLRPGTVVGQGCRVGDFVEVKNATLGDGTKASHLTYIGDADVGSGVNLGCGVVFVNYDGTNKYRTTVEDGAFIGCNANLVAPVTVGEGAYIAAGSTVTEDVEADALFIARARGETKPGWPSRKGILRRGRTAKDAR